MSVEGEVLVCVDGVVMVPFTVIGGLAVVVDWVVVRVVDDVPLPAGSVMLSVTQNCKGLE